MAPDFLQLGAKWPLESKCYFEACVCSYLSCYNLASPRKVWIFYFKSKKSF